MEYTIQVSRVNDDNNLKAMASITFEGAYKVNNISIVEAKGHTFINMPSYQTHEVDDNLSEDKDKNIDSPIKHNSR